MDNGGGIAMNTGKLKKVVLLDLVPIIWGEIWSWWDNKIYNWLGTFKLLGYFYFENY